MDLRTRLHHFFVRPPSRMRKRILEDETLAEQLTRIAVECDKSTDDILQMADRYTREIIANIHPRMVKFLSWPLQFIFNRLYDDIVIDAEAMERLKKLVEERPVVLVPNHKSHLDYLLLSHTLRRHGIPLPLVAAGKNLSFWPLGPLFRWGGAFFIRRSFKGNDVYRTVLETYLRILLEEKRLLEFFIEGGRSRSGKLGAPRFGILSMLIREAEKGVAPDLTFVPVAITYDQVVEERSYVRELEGEEKQTERMTDLVRLTRFLKRPAHRNGAIFLSFGKPIPAFPPETQGNVDIPKLAHNICHEINRNLVITPASLLSMALLSSLQPGVTVRDLLERAQLLLRFPRELNLPMAPFLRVVPVEALRAQLSLFVDRRLIRLHSDHPTPFVEIPPEKRLAIDYFKNASLHYLAPLSLVSSLVRGTNLELMRVADLLGPYRLLTRLLAREFCFSEAPVDEVEVEEYLRFLQHETPEARELLAQLLHPLLEGYALTLSFLSRLHGTIPERTLLKGLLRYGQQELLLGQHPYREALSRELLRNAIETMLDWGFLETLGERGSRHFSLVTSLKQEKTRATLQATLERMV